MKITLKAARINMGYSQREAAAKLGISVDTLGNYERGKSYPDVLTINKIEGLYGVKYEDIIFCPELRINRNMGREEERRTGLERD